MKATHKSALKEILSREKLSYNFADATALGGTKPENILAQFSFKEFNQLIERIRKPPYPLS